MFKILFLLFSAISASFAVTAYPFIVDSPTMVDSYWNIFNAMAAFFQSAQYMEILKIVVLLGGVFIFIAGALKTFQGGNGGASLGSFFKYIMVIVVLLVVVFSKQVPMVIKTNNIPSVCGITDAAAATQTAISKDAAATGVVIDNMPMVLAWTFSFINEIGRKTTHLAVTAFSPETGDFTHYKDNSDYAAYLSGISSLLSTKFINLVSDSKAQGGDVSLLSGLEAIQRDCVLIPGSKSAEGNILINAFATTGDLYQTMDDFFKNGDINVYKKPHVAGGAGAPPATNLVSNLAGFRFQPHDLHPANALVTVNGSMMRCGALWTKLSQDLVKLRDSGAIECAEDVKANLNGATINILTGGITGTTPLTNGQVVSYTRSIGIHAGLMNQFLESKNKIAPSEISYAAGKSMGDFVTSSLGTGYYMAKILPYLQMGMRAILYAFFPFVYIVVLLPGGLKTLASYLQTLIWIELWSPTAAILNMFLSLQSKEQLQVLYNVKGFNPANTLQIFSDVTQMASVAGYLYASIPALTWLILKGSGYMLGNITGAVAARMTTNMDSRSINQDMGSLKQQAAVNSARVSEGERMLSLAEMDTLSAQMQGLSAGGQFLASHSMMNSLTSASRGEQLRKLITGTSTDAMLHNNRDMQNTVSAMTAKELTDKNALFKELGIQGANGAINEDRLRQVANVLGVKEGIDFRTEEGMQKLADKFSRADAATQAALKAYGSNSGIMNQLSAALSGYDGDRQAEAKAIKRRLDRGDIGAIDDAALLLAPVGARADTFNKLTADQKAAVESVIGSAPLGAAYGAQTSSNLEKQNMGLNTLMQSDQGRGQIQDTLTRIFKGQGVSSPTANSLYTGRDMKRFGDYSAEQYAEFLTQTNEGQNMLANAGIAQRSAVESYNSARMSGFTGAIGSMSEKLAYEEISNNGSVTGLVKDLKGGRIVKVYAGAAEWNISTGFTDNHTAAQFVQHLSNFAQKANLSHQSVKALKEIMSGKEVNINGKTLSPNNVEGAVKEIIGGVVSPDQLTKLLEMSKKLNFVTK